MTNFSSSRVQPGDFIDLGHGFWNARGSFKIGGVLEAGTQASLVRRPDGSFVMLDSVALTGEALEGVMRLTQGGAQVSAILNLHPFHTLHCEEASQRFTNATLYGTSRHKEKAPGLDWADENVESEAVAERFADTLAFSKPEGVDFISDDQNVHFSSLLAFHRPSGTVHSDDTLSYTKLPFPVSLVKRETPLFFHPTLGKALEKRAGAAADFRAWALALAQDWSGARHLCAAHNGILQIEGDFASQVKAALDRVERTLAKHEKEQR